MSEPDFISGTIVTSDSPFESTLKTSDWLTSSSFGEGFKRSIYLLQKHFRWLVVTFFIGGLILSLITFPINSITAFLNELIISELLAPTLNFEVLLFLLRISTIFGLSSDFLIFLGAYLLGAVALFHVLKSEATLKVLVTDIEGVKLPIMRIMLTGLMIAGILTIASIIPFLVPFVQVLLFFIPIVLILDGCSIGKAFRLSFEMRRKHWQRILSILILTYILMLFAGTLGGTVYLNIEAAFLFYGIALGVIGPILLILLNQIFVAMVAPLLPLFLITFYSGAKEALRERRFDQYLRQTSRRQQVQSQLIPMNEKIKNQERICSQCNIPLKENAKFCSQCGASVL